MPRVHFVKKARKDNPVAKKGESYHYWTPFRSSKKYSKEYPRQSQLCTGRKSSVMAAQESLADDLSGTEEADVIRQSCESCAETFRELGDEYRESAENMREYFPDSEQADSMEEMADSLDNAADSLEGLDFEIPDLFEDEEPEEPNTGDFGTDDEYEEAFDTWQGEHDEWTSLKEENDNEREAFIDNLKEEAQSASDEVEFMF